MRVCLMVVLLLALRLRVELADPALDVVELALESGLLLQGLNRLSLALGGARRGPRLFEPGARGVVVALRALALRGRQGVPRTVEKDPGVLGRGRVLGGADRKLDVGDFLVRDLRARRAAGRAAAVRARAMEGCGEVFSRPGLRASDIEPPSLTVPRAATSEYRYTPSLWGPLKAKDVPRDRRRSASEIRIRAWKLSARRHGDRRRVRGRRVRAPAPPPRPPRAPRRDAAGEDDRRARDGPPRRDGLLELLPVGQPGERGGAPEARDGVDRLAHPRGGAEGRRARGRRARRGPRGLRRGRHAAPRVGAAPRARARGSGIAPRRGRGLRRRRDGPAHVAGSREVAPGRARRPVSVLLRRDGADRGARVARPLEALRALALGQGRGRRLPERPAFEGPSTRLS